MQNDISIAYFSMEIALESAIPTYSGGLGVLAGDTLRSAADTGLHLAGITLLSRKGYFRQRLDQDGWQSEDPVHWPVADYLLPTDVQATVELENRSVTIRAWRYDIKGNSGHVVPVYLLDTDVEGNSEYDRTLTDFLYGGDQYYRLCQEAVLGIGGIRILRALGCSNIERYHMNEGHSSLLVFELMAEQTKQHGDVHTATEYLQTIRRECIFTTHTPVAAGHDRFPTSLAYRVLNKCDPFIDCAEAVCCDDELNLTHLALEASYYINGVAKAHRETSRKMFGTYHIDSITNGVHAFTWTSDPIRDLFYRKIPDWRDDNLSLRYAISIPNDEIWQAHQLSKRRLIEYVNKVCNIGMDHNVMTLGFARRSTMYKRSTLLFTDIERLKTITSHCGPLQIIFGGKAHPKDTRGKELIHEIFRIKKMLNNEILIAYLPDYDMEIGRLMTSGVDLWLNTPLPPMEASGTSGMKAAINGVPSLSVLDGWWVEGCIEGVTGWAISNGQQQTTDAALSISVATNTEAEILYSKLENIILPMYYQNRDAYIQIMKNTISINGSFFNTERMLSQYVTKAYFR